MTCPDEWRWVHDLAARLGSDRYARYVGRPGLKYAEVAEPVTPDVIDMHLRNEQAIALPALSLPDENKGHAIVFDFDDHNGEITDDRMVRTVCQFSDLLKAAPHFIVQSSSGTGYHVWLVFEQPARKDVLRERALKTIEAFNKKHPDLALKEGAKGLPQGQVEIFPKGRASGGGCMIALPCARQSMLVKAKQTPLGAWQLPHYGNEQTLPLIKPKKPGRKPANGDGAQPDPEAAFVALVSDRDPNDYDDWIQVAMRLIAAFGAHDSWAFERWAEWASTAARPDPRHELEKKWHACSSTTLSPFTFWLDARDRGYSGKLPLSKKEERQQDVQRLLHGIELHRGEDGLAYAVVGPRRVVLVESEEFQDFLRLAAAEQGNIIKTDEVKELSALAAANARAKDPTSIALRFGREGERRFVFWFAIEYEAQRREASQDAADGDSVLAFILWLCSTQHDDTNRLELNATALMDLMVQKVANREIFAARDDMPSNPRVLSSRMARIIPTLNDYGVRVRRGNQRAFIIEWDGADLSACDQFMLAQMPF